MGWGTGNVGSGSGGLNFKIVGGTVEPANAKENTIWVNTDVPITSYSFSATEPTDFTEGMVWIHTGASSTTAFNALRKNAVQVYPNAASQHINGSWVSKDAMMYQNGNWLSWTFYLYDKGVFNKTAGNLVQKAISYNGANPGPITIEKRTGSVSIRPNGGTSGLAYFDNQIDLTPYETLCFYGRAEILASGGSPMCGIGVWDTSFQPVALLEGMRPDGLYTLDISAISGTHYIGIAVYGFTDYMECELKQLYLK